MDVNSREPSQNIIPFRIKGTEVARFDICGNLGIGTSAPSAILDVVGNVKINGELYVNGTPLTSLTSGVVVNMDSQPVAATALNRQKKQSIPLTAGSTLATSDVIAKMSGVSVGKTQVYGVGPAQMASYGNIVVAVGDGGNSIAYSLTNPPTAASWVGVPNSAATFTTRGYNIAYANGTWVAVGEGTNSIAYSTTTPPVASSWVGIRSDFLFNGVVNTFSSRSWNIAYGNGAWVAVGGGTNSIAYSLANPPTAESWVGIPLSFSPTIFGNDAYGITFGNGTWVAVGAGPNGIAYSTRTPPTADSWVVIPLTNVNDAGSTNTPNSASYRVIYANGVWLVGGPGTNTLCYSVENPPIAGSWMPITTGVLFGAEGRPVAYGNGTWVACGHSGPLLAYSTSRIPHSSSWVAMKGPTPSSSSEIINNISFNPATNTWYFTGDIGSNCMFYSTATPPVPATWIGVPRSASTFTTQAFGAAGITTSAFTSPINVARLDNKVTFPVNRMLAVGGGGGGVGGTDVLARSALTPAPNGGGTISYSDDDGATWTMVPGGATNAMFSSAADIAANASFGVGGSRGANAVAWNGEKWVAAGNGRTNSLAFSDDGGMTWNGITGKSIFSVEARDVAWNGRMWVAVGRGVNFSTAYSYDGVTWMGPVTDDVSGIPMNVFSYDIAGPTVTASMSDISGGGNHVIWTGKMWVATGTRTLISGSSPTAYYTVAYSMDGKSWTGVPESGATSTGFDMYAHGIAWNGRNFVATGRGTVNTLAFSTDATATASWQGLGNSVFSVWGRGITWGARRWMATGRGTNTVAYSTNGRNWQGCGANVFKPLRRFMAMGDTGLYTAASGAPQRGVAFSYSDDGVTWDAPVVNQAVEFSTPLGGTSDATRSAVFTNNILLTNAITDIASAHTSLMFSADGGASWARVPGTSDTEANGGTGMTTANNGSYSLAMNPTRTRFLVGGGDAASATKKVYFSNDGFNWRNSVSSPNTSQMALVWASLWVGGGYNRWLVGGSDASSNSNGRIMYSGDADAIAAWLPVSPATYTATVVCCFAANTDFSLILAGATSGNVIYRSVNGGANWTTVDISGTPTGSVSSIAFSPALGRWVAVGGGGGAANTIIYSTDATGTAWIAPPQGAKTAATAIFKNGSEVSRVIWDALGARFLVGGWNGAASTAALTNVFGLDATANNNPGYTMAYSADGINWTPVTVRSSDDGAGASVFGPFLTRCREIMALDVSGDFTPINTGYSVSWNSYANRFVATGNGTTPVVYSNDGGVTWTPANQQPPQQAIVVAGGASAAANTTSVSPITYTIDGKTWFQGLGAKEAFGSAGTVMAVRYGQTSTAISPNGRIWVAGGTGTSSIAFSQNGIRWTPVANATTMITNVRAIVYAAPAAEQTSTTPATSGVGNGVWVAGGDISNSLVFSYDGISWSEVPNSLAILSRCNAIAYGSTGTGTGLFVAGGLAGTIDPTANMAYSTDGYNWQPIRGSGSRISSSGASINCITYGRDENGRGLWVAGAFGSSTVSILYSYNGIDWVGVVGSGGSLSSTVTGLAYGVNSTTGRGLWVASVYRQTSGQTPSGYSFLFSANGRDEWTPVPNTKAGLFEVNISSGATSVAYLNGVWYATGLSAGVSTGRTLAYSYEGSSGWFGVYPTTNLYGVAVTTYSATSMLCVATTGEYAGAAAALTPIRGLGWTAGVGSAYLQHPTIVFGASGAQQAAATAAMSTDGGRSWGASTLSIATSAFRGGVCNDALWNGIVWAAVGYDAVSGAKVATSKDGVTWTQIPAGSVPIAGVLYSIMWNGSVWMAGGDGSPTNDLNTNSIAWSPDLAAWTGIANTDTKLRVVKRIAWNGMYWVAVGSGDVSTIMHSRDKLGLVWEDTYMSGVSVNKTAVAMSAGNDVVWGGGRWVAVGRPNNSEGNNAASIIYSVDTEADYAIAGRRWTAVAGSAQLFPYGANSVSWNGKRFIATGPASCAASTGNIIAWSADGMSWTAYSTAKTVAPGQRWVAVGSGSRACIALSADGQVWTDVSGSAVLFPDISGASSALVSTMKTGGRAIGWNGSSLVAGGARAATTVTASTTTSAATMATTGRTTIPVCAFIGSGNGVMGGGTTLAPMDATAAGILRTSSSVFITHMDVNMRESSAPWANMWLNTYTDLSGTQLFQVTPETQTFSSALKWNGWSWVANFGMTTFHPQTGEQYGSIWYCSDPLARVGWSVASNSIAPRILIGQGGYAALEWNGVAWLACGYDPNNNNMIYTTDKYGATGWTAVSGTVSGAGSASFQPVCIASSSRFWVVGGSQGAGESAIYYTSDRTGATGWRAVTTTGVGASVLPAIRITSMGYNGSTWICCGGGRVGTDISGGSISWRADLTGANAAEDFATGWTAATVSGTSGGIPPIMSASSAIATNAGAGVTAPIWVVVGEDLSGNGGGQIAYTTDITGSSGWKKPATGTLPFTTFGRLNGIAWTGYSWIATSGAGFSRLASTTDPTAATQWNNTTNGLFTPTLSTNAVAFVNIPISLLTTGMPSSAGAGAGTGAMWRAGAGRAQGLLPGGGTETTSVVVRSSNGAEGTRWSQTYARNFLIAVGGSVIRDASGGGGTNRMAYSYDGGLSWTTNNTAVLTSDASNVISTIRTVKYGNGMWVAGGDAAGSSVSGNNCLAWSRDGVNWVGAGGTQIFGSAGACYAVCCNDRGRWVAVGGAPLGTVGTYTNTSGSIYTMAWSDDGMNWTPVIGSRALFGIVCQGVTYGADASGVGMWTAIGRGTTYTGCAYSYDGKTWFLSQTSGSLFTTSVNVLTERYAPVAADWRTVAITSNGQIQFAGANGGLVYRSMDYGVTWSALTLPSRNWVSVAVSSTGQYVVAASSDGSVDRLYNSSDYGATWVARGLASNAWVQVAISASGQYQCGVSSNLDHRSSRDYGVTWASIPATAGISWTGIAISSSGQYITTVANSNPYVSSDYGVSWLNRDTSRSWNCIAMSSTGQIQIAGLTTSGVMYISTNYGVTFTNTGSSPSVIYRSLAISSTGQYRSGVTTSASDTIKRSNNFDAGWTSVNPAGNYFAIAMSSTGQYQTAVSQTTSGLIYISSNFGETWSAAATDSRSLGVAYGKDASGVGMWVVAAGRRDRDISANLANTMAYSYDGKLWRGIRASAGLSEQAWSVAYGKDGFGVGMWVCAGYDTHCGLKWSYDGVTWNATMGASGAAVWAGMAAGRRALAVYWNGSMWLASTSDTRNGEPRGTSMAVNNASSVPGYLLYSYNGKNWLPVLAPNTYGVSITGTAQASVYSVLPNPAILDFGSFYDDQAQRGVTITNTTARTVGAVMSGGVPIENINTIVPYGRGSLTTGQVPFLLGGDSGLMDVLQPDTAMTSILNETNWYSLMTAGDSAGSLSGSGTLVQSTLVSGGNFQYGRWSYNSVPISTHSTLTFTGEILWTPESGYNAGDYYTVTFGASSSNIFEGITVMFMFWNGYTNNGFAGTGIYLLKNGVAIAKSNTLPNGPGSSQWFPISIIYTKSTLNTWQVNINNVSALTYSDPNALAWATTAGNWFIVLAYSGAGLRMSLLIRKLYLGANTGYLPTRPITSDIASTTTSLSTSTDGGITWRAVPNSTRVMTKVNKILCDETTQQIVAVGTGNYSVATSTPATAGSADGWVGVFGSRMTDTRAGLFEKYGTGASWFGGAKMWIASGRAQSRRGSSLAVSVNGTVWQDAKIVSQMAAGTSLGGRGGGLTSRTTGGAATTTVVTPITITTTTTDPGTGALYTFTAFTFDNAAATGRFGPDLSACRTRYATQFPTATWAQNSSYLNMSSDASGIQLWTVPATGSYTIRAVGAAGGNPGEFGRGRDISLNTTLTKGEVIKILVGQMGSSNTNYYTAGGGGGGTFVVRDVSNAIIVAGGGGGRAGNYGSINQYSNSNGSINTNGNKSGDGTNANDANGGTNGGGGNSAYRGTSGGGGLIGAGINPSEPYSTGGSSFILGGIGGYGQSDLSPGGFGGGGGTYGYGGGGGGGGYSGGGAGYGYSTDPPPKSGGGGGSFPSNATDNGVTNTTHGSVTITPNFTITSPTTTTTTTTSSIITTTTSPITFNSSVIPYTSAATPLLTYTDSAAAFSTQVGSVATNSQYNRAVVGGSGVQFVAGGRGGSGGGIAVSNDGQNWTAAASGAGTVFQTPTNTTTRTGSGGFDASFGTVALTQRLTPPTSYPSGVLIGISLSKTGQYQTAVAEGGNIWTSSDYGVTWTERITGATRTWSQVSLSSTGQYQTAVVSSGNIWTSSDYGVTWSERFVSGSTRVWRGLSISSSGQYQTAVWSTGFIWTSSDYGVNWVSRLGSFVWRSVSVSSTGQYQTATPDGNIHISSDFGVSWSSITAPGSRDFINVSLSSTGQYQTTVVNGGNIWSSSDFGNTWVERTTPGNSGRRGISLSSTGQYQTATVNSGNIWTSSDFGVTWTSRATVLSWWPISISSTGQYQTAATTTSGNIYTSTDFGVTWVQRSTDTRTNAFTRVRSSASGQYQLATSGPVGNTNGQLYVSSDYGRTWMPRRGLGTWLGGAVSATGAIMTTFSTPTAATAAILRSTDYGATFTDIPGTTLTSPSYWRAIAATNSAATQTALAHGSTIYRSTDYGSTWNSSAVVDVVGILTTEFSSVASPILAWKSIAMSSADAKIQTGVVANGQIYVNSNYGREAWTAVDSSRNWTAVAMSADGRYQSAVVSSGAIYYNSTSGTGTWTAVSTPAPGFAWTGIAVSSADGKYQTAVASGATNIYVNSNFGVGTWTAKESARNWFGVAMSATGQYQTAINRGGFIYIDASFGTAASWTPVDFQRDWASVAMSSTGQYQTAVVAGGKIYVNSNYGAHGAWTETESNRAWISVAVSGATGRYQTAVAQNAQIYTNANFGAGAWSAVDSSRNWVSVTVSSDGKYQSAVVATSGQVYFSRDFGATWSTTAGVDIMGNRWQDVAVSAETGAVQVTCVSGGYLYVSSDGMGANWVSTTVSIDGVVPQATNRVWQAVAVSANGQYGLACVNSTSASGFLYRSTNSGASWSSSNIIIDGAGSQATNRPWQDVGMSANGKYQVACVGTSGSIFYSKNYGASWTSLTAAGSRSWSSVALSENGGTISATTNDASGGVWVYSMPDDQYYRAGAVANAGGGAPTTTPATVRAIAYGNSGVGAAVDGYWVAGADASANSLAYSSNGVDWTAVAGSKTTLFNAVNGVAYGADTSGTPLWVAVGLPFVGSVPGSTAYSIAYSYNMTQWTGVRNAANFTGQGNHVAYGQDEFGAGVWVAVGQGDGVLSANLGDSALYNSNGTTNTTVFYSYDGANWAAGTGAGVFAVSGTDVAWGVDASGVGMWVATGIGFTDPTTGVVVPGGQVAHSTNGRVWTPIRASAPITPAMSPVTLPTTFATRGGAIPLPPASSGFTASIIGSAWSQLGLDISGTQVSEQSGISVSLSADGTTVAIGSANYDIDAKGNVGRTRVYKYNSATSSWGQLGLDISGTQVEEYSGESVSLSADGTTVAIGSRYYDKAGGTTDASTNEGRVRIYKYNKNGTSSWDLLGAEILGTQESEYNGVSVSLSADGTIVAIGSSVYDKAGGTTNANTNEGRTRVYKYNKNGTSSWDLLGSEILGTQASEYNGVRVSLSADGTTLAIGSAYYDKAGGTTNANTDEGRTRVYKYNKNGTFLWDLLGAEILGTQVDEESGYSVSLSADGTTLAIGSAYYDKAGGTAQASTNEGRTRIYKYNKNGTSSWDLLGAEILGTQAQENSGYSVSLSADGTIVAIGSRYYDVTGSNNEGRTRIYKYIGTAWTQLGLDISGTQVSEHSGWSVSLSADGTMIAIGYLYYDTSVNDAGRTRIYKLDITGATFSTSNPAIANIVGNSILFIKDGASGTTTITATQPATPPFTAAPATVQGTLDVSGTTYTLTYHTFYPIFTPFPGAFAGDSPCVAYGRGGSQGAGAPRWIVGGAGGTNVFAMSSAPTTIGAWSVVGSFAPTANAPFPTCNSLAYSNGVWVASNNTDDANIIARSTDGGSTWTPVAASSVSGILTGAAAVGANSFCNYSLAVADFSNDTNLRSWVAVQGTKNFFFDGGVSAVATVTPDVSAVVYNGIGQTTSTIATAVSVMAPPPGALATTYGTTWNRLGTTDISGVDAGEQSGYSVSLSADGTTVAIGARGNNGNRGVTRIYKLTGNAWGRLGTTDISGVDANENSGSSVSLSADGTTVAIGAYNNNSARGVTRIYKLTGNAWGRLGTTDISGVDAGEASGASVSLSADGTTVAVGAFGNNSGRGVTRIYKLTGNTWTRLGTTDISGVDVTEYSGISVSLSADGTTVAVGAFGNNSGRGVTRVYKLTGNAWGRLGTTDISGVDAGENSGYSVSLSADGTTVAVGAYGNNGSRGVTRVYKLTGNAWGRLGTTDISGVDAGEQSGLCVSLSADGTTVAIGAGSNSSSKGITRSYKLTGNVWTRLGTTDISGVDVNEYSGSSVSLSADGTTVAVGAYGNNSGRGVTRVYKIPVTNGISYTSSSSSVADIYGNLLLVKGVNGTSNIVATQGATTTTGTLTVAGTVYTLVYDSFKAWWVAGGVGLAGAASIGSTTDPSGATGWTKATSPAIANLATVNAIAFSPFTQRWLAVGVGATGSLGANVLTTSDATGATWTAGAVTSALTPVITLNTCVWNQAPASASAAGRWLAAGTRNGTDASSACVYISTDASGAATPWTPITGTGAILSQVYSLAFNGNVWIAAGAPATDNGSTSTLMRTTTDTTGATGWQGIPVTNISTSGFDTAARSVTWNADQQMWVATGENTGSAADASFSSVIYSRDVNGAPGTWRTVRESNSVCFSGEGTGVAFTGDKWFAVGDNGSGSGSGSAVVATSGTTAANAGATTTTWTPVTHGTALTRASDIAYTGRRLVASGASASGATSGIIYSSNGTGDNGTWTSVPNVSAGAFNDASGGASSITFEASYEGTGRLVATGRSATNALSVSTDGGVSWTAPSVQYTSSNTFDTTTTPMFTTGGNSVAYVGNDTLFAGGGNDVHWNGKRWVATGRNSVAAASVTVTSGTAPPDVVNNNTAPVATSEDGITWQCVRASQAPTPLTEGTFIGTNSRIGATPLINSQIVITDGGDTESVADYGGMGGGGGGSGTGVAQIDIIAELTPVSNAAASVVGTVGIIGAAGNGGVNGVGHATTPSFDNTAFTITTRPM